MAVKKSGVVAPSKSVKQAKKTGVKNPANNKQYEYKDRFGDTMMDEIILLLIIVFSAIVLISLFTNGMGAAGAFISSFLKGLIGFGAFIMPLAAIVICLKILCGRGSATSSMPKVIGCIVFTIAAAILFHIINVEPVPGESISKLASRLYKDGASFNGGVIGGLLGTALSKAFSKIGAYIFVSALLIISFIMITGKSLINLFTYTADYMDEHKKMREERVKVRTEKARQDEWFEITNKNEQLEKEIKRKMRQKNCIDILMGMDLDDGGKELDRGYQGYDNLNYYDDFEPEIFDSFMPEEIKMYPDIENDTPKPKGKIYRYDDEKQNKKEKEPKYHDTGLIIKMPSVVKYEKGEDFNEPLVAGINDIKEYFDDCELEENTALAKIKDGINDYNSVETLPVINDSHFHNENPENSQSIENLNDFQNEEYAEQKFEEIKEAEQTKESPQSQKYTENKESLEGLKYSQEISNEAAEKPQYYEDYLYKGKNENEIIIDEIQDNELYEYKNEEKSKINDLKTFENINTENVEYYDYEDASESKKVISISEYSNNVQAHSYQEESKQYIFPSLSLLRKPQAESYYGSRGEMLSSAKKLEETLKSFGVEARVIQINRGPTVTRFELSPNQGVKVSKIVNLADDIALNLAANGIRIEAPIPGKAAVGIEVPNKETRPVYLRSVLDTDTFKNFPSKLAFAVGQDISGNAVVTDIAKMPHLLIAGATGSGKSVCINTLITSILYKASPDEVKLLLVDPKVVELSVYNGIPHLLIPVVTDPKKAAGALNWAVREMLQRYQDFSANNVRDIYGYNKKKAKEGGESPMCQIVIVIDELADLMMAAPGEVEDSICRLAQMARAAGIHLIIATQRPSVDIITGVIKANIPSRLAFAVSSGTDSRTILDMVGAEKLLGKGDMLFYPVGMGKPQRIQGAFVTDKEVENIVEFLKKQGKMSFDDDMIEKITSSSKSVGSSDDADEFLEQAVQLITSKGKASVSMLQRQFRIGYNRAARLMEDLESRGIVGPEDGSKPRKVLMSYEQFIQSIDDE